MFDLISIWALKLWVIRVEIEPNSLYKELLAINLPHNTQTRIKVISQTKKIGEYFQLHLTNGM